MKDHLEKLAIMESHTQNSEESISPCFLTREVKIKEAKIFKIHKNKDVKEATSSSSNNQPLNTEHSVELYSL